jgi:hypothetical protein
MRRPDWRAAGRARFLGIERDGPGYGGIVPYQPRFAVEQLIAHAFAMLGPIRPWSRPLVRLLGFPEPSRGFAEKPADLAQVLRRRRAQGALFILVVMGSSRSGEPAARRR